MTSGARRTRRRGQLLRAVGRARLALVGRDAAWHRRRARARCIRRADGPGRRRPPDSTRIHARRPGRAWPRRCRRSGRPYGTPPRSGSRGSRMRIGAHVARSSRPPTWQSNGRNPLRIGAGCLRPSDSCVNHTPSTVRPARRPLWAGSSRCATPGGACGHPHRPEAATVSARGAGRVLPAAGAVPAAAPARCARSSSKPRRRWPRGCGLQQAAAGGRSTSSGRLIGIVLCGWRGARHPWHGCPRRTARATARPGHLGAHEQDARRCGGAGCAARSARGRPSCPRGRCGPSGAAASRVARAGRRG